MVDSADTLLSDIGSLSETAQLLSDALAAVSKPLCAAIIPYTAVITTIAAASSAAILVAARCWTRAVAVAFQDAFRVYHEGLGNRLCILWGHAHFRC